MIPIESIQRTCILHQIITEINACAVRADSKRTIFCKLHSMPFRFHRPQMWYYVHHGIEYCTTYAENVMRAAGTLSDCQMRHSSSSIVQNFEFQYSLDTLDLAFSAAYYWICYSIQMYYFGGYRNIIFKHIFLYKVYTLLCLPEFLEMIENSNI